MIGILWNRIGMALDKVRYARPDGGPAYESGTVFEIEVALERLKKAALPDVALFRKRAPPTEVLSQDAAEELARNLGLMKQVTDRWLKTNSGSFKAAFNSFTDPDDFERQFEQHLRGWLTARGHGTDGVNWRIRDQDGRDRTPYPGLEAYGTEYATVFCGRDQALDLCLQDLRAAAQRGCAFLLLLGASGSGKSSLARAGLLPRLNKPGSAPGVDGWREATFRPGLEPLAALAQALFAALPELSETGTPTPSAWGATVRGHAEAAADTVKAALRRAGAKASARTPQRLKLLLLVDQLEEAFAATPEERAAFAAALSALARSDDAWVVATLRDDRYAGLLEQPLLLALKRDGATHDLAPPEGAELEAIIRIPARLSGLSFERGADGGDLAAVLRRDVTDSDALPLLQMTLARLFEERDRASNTLTFRAYNDFGGLTGAIDQRAEEVFARANAAAQSELPALLLGLVGGVGEDGKILAREAPAAALADTPARRELLDLLVEGRLLLTDGREAPDGSRQVSVRVAHEALLRNWTRAQKILAPEPLRAKPRVEQAQRDWQAGGERKADLLRGALLEGAQALVDAHGAALPTSLRNFVALSAEALKREKQWERWRFRGAIAAAIVLALTAGWAGWQSVVASREAKEAERQLGLAEASRADATAQRDAAVRFARGLIRTVRDLQKDFGTNPSTILALVDYAESELQKLERAVPGEEVRQLRAEALLRRASILGSLHRWPEANTARGAGMAAAEAGVLRAPSAEWLRLRAGAHTLAAESAFANGAHVAAWAAIEADAADAAAALMRDPNNPDLALDLFMARARVAESAEARGDLETADRIVQELLRALPSEGSASPAQLRARAAVLSFAAKLDLNYRAYVSAPEQRQAEAEQLLRRAADMDGAPQTDLGRDLLFANLRGALAFGNTGKLQTDSYIEIQQIIKRLGVLLEAIHPNHNGVRLLRADLQRNLVETAFAARNFVVARNEIDAGIAELRALANEIANFQGQSRLAHALELAAQILVAEDKQRNAALALQRMDEALGIRLAAVNAESSDPARAEAWMRTALMRAMLLSATGASAEATMNAATNLRRYVDSWLSSRPRHHRLVEIAVAGEAILLDLSFAAGRSEDGVAAMHRAIAYIEGLGPSSREPKWLTMKAGLLEKAAAPLFSRKSQQEGLKTIQQAIQAAGAAATHPESARLLSLEPPRLRAIHAGLMAQSPDAATRRAAPAEARAAVNELIQLQSRNYDPRIFGTVFVTCQYILSETLALAGEHAAAQQERQRMEARLNALRSILSAEEFTALQNNVRRQNVRPVRPN